MLFRTHLKYLLAVGLLLGVAACSSGGGDDNNNPPPATGSDSYQDYANDQGALDFTAVDPELDSNWQARASEALLSAVTDLSFANVRSKNTDNANFPDDTWDDAFFTDTNYIGAVRVGIEQACIDIDNTSNEVTSGSLLYDDSLFDCAAGPAAQEVLANGSPDAGNTGETAILNSGEVTQTDALIDSTYASRATAAVLLTPTTVTFNDVRGKNTHNTNFPDDTWNDTFFEDTDYIGAVDPDPAVIPWWDGWTLQEGKGSLKPGTFHPLQAEIENGTIIPAASANCPGGFSSPGSATVFTKVFPICVIDDDIMGDMTLTNDQVYLIDGTINVGDGGEQNATPGTVTPVTLTIDPGVQIFGDQTASTAGIVITRGSKVRVMGTADMPVVMSSADGGNISTANNNFSGYNEWGGLIVDGFAMVNAGFPAVGAEVLSEAAPTGVDRYFGGSNPKDNSGEIHYLVVTESGQEFRTDEEIQGLTLEGVGSGTVIDHVHIHQSGDDGIEWFGGTVNAKYLVITGPDDDGLDMDLGYQGGIQFALVVQTDDRGDKGIESDNNGDAFDATPISMPTLANITLVGDVGKSSATTTGALHREGMGGFFYNMIITDKSATAGWEDGCLDVDHTVARIDEGSFKYFDAIFNCASGSLAANEAVEAVP